MIEFKATNRAKDYYLEPAGKNAVGLIPMLFSESDPRSAREQIDANYQHGGGFFELKGYTMDAKRVLRGFDRPPMPVLAEAKLRDETILVYPSAYVAIVQTDGSYVVTHMD